MRPRPPVSDPTEAVRLLRRGDVIFLTFVDEFPGRLWKLVHARREVPETLVRQLQQGGRFGRRTGRLVHQSDALLPVDEISQTWRWAEE